jgi:hypothetical protein
MRPVQPDFSVTCRTFVPALTLALRASRAGSFQLSEARDRSLFDARTFGLYPEREASLDEVRLP